MTKKDYELIAREIKHSKKLAQPNETMNAEGRQAKRQREFGVYFTAVCIANGLQTANARFDRHTFMTACGFPRFADADNVGLDHD